MLTQNSARRLKKCVDVDDRSQPGPLSRDRPPVAGLASAAEALGWDENADVFLVLDVWMCY
jgi:hypothetical protein